MNPEVRSGLQRKARAHLPEAYYSDSRTASRNSTRLPFAECPEYQCETRAPSKAVSSFVQSIRPSRDSHFPFLSDKHLILVDDVLTTGSTINECARILKLAGAQTILALTVSRAGLKSHADVS